MKTPSPLVLAFHGYTSSASNMTQTHLHEAWPEATIVYPQGLRVYRERFQTSVPAWQAAPGRDDDRDVAFVDVLLDELGKSFKVDERRIYATGLSNGALFCYVLLAMRPQPFAAFGCVAGAADFVRDATVPRPVLLIQGKNDTTVKPEAAAATRDLLRKLNGCGDEQVEWIPGYISYQPCATAQPVIWRLHDGGHSWPSEATNNLVRFFKEHALPEALPE